MSSEVVAKRGVTAVVLRVLVYALVIGLAITMLFPFAWTLLTSITPGANLATAPNLDPSAWSFDSYVTLFGRLNMPTYIVNSVVVAAATTVFQLVTGATAAYAFARISFPARNVIFVCYLATMMIPLQVAIVPLFVQMRALGLNDSYFALIAPSAASALSIFILRQAMLSIPRDLDEAAAIDGAGHIRIFTTVILPLTKPALATVGILVFLGSWNSFLWPLVVVRNDALRTLPLGLSSLQGLYSSDWSVVLAGSVVSILPVLVLFVFAQRYFVAGIAGTGIK